MSAKWDEHGLYIVTDIETDGPWPGINSMLAFASVAVDQQGRQCGEFEAVLQRLPGSQPTPETMQWWQGFPEAYAASTADPRPAAEVMHQFVSWMQEFGRPVMFAASPLMFDGSFIDFYLRRFTRYGICQGPDETDKLFSGPGLCLSSYAAAHFGCSLAEVKDHFTPELLGDHEHTHRAIDDARGYAHLLGVLLSQRH